MSSSSHDKIDALVPNYGQAFEPDVEKGLVRLHQRLGIQNTKPERLRKSANFARLLSIAAAALLLIAASVFFFNDSTTLHKNTSAAPMAVELPDGTEVILQTGAELSYEGSFTGSERRIELEGQGYFHVAKDASRPFLVTNDSTTLRVTGTAFNLRIVGRELEVEVEEGSVELSFNDQLLPISAKQCGLSKDGKAPVLMDAPYLNRHAWRTGKMVFENTPIGDVVKALENSWGIEIDLPEDCTFPFSSTVTGKNAIGMLEDVAKISAGEVKNLSEDTYFLDIDCKK